MYLHVIISADKFKIEKIAFAWAQDILLPERTIQLRTLLL